MKLLVVSSWFPYPADNGSRLRAFNLLRELSARHTITLLALGAPVREDDVAALGALCTRIETAAPGRIPDTGLGVRGLFSPVPRHFLHTHSPRLQGLITAALPGHDAVVALQVEAARYVAPFDLPVPAVFDEVEVGVLRDQFVSEPHLLRRLRHGLTWVKYRRYVARLISRFAYATVVSDVERRHLGAIGCDLRRIVVVPNGIALHEGLAANRDRRRLVYPGSVTYAANRDAVEYLVRDILPLLRRTLPDVTLRVTGSTEGVDIGRLERIEGVTFTGALPDVSPTIAESAACVVPLRIGGGTRLKILHAMAVGTPVVSTTKGIEGLELVPDEHVLVADAPEAFATQIARLLADASLADRLRERGGALVRQRHAWGPIARILEATIERAVAEHRDTRSR